MATVLPHPFGTTAFGDFLRSARERRGLTIQQIAHETKIPQRLLESLEHGDLGAIPAGMYQRAEIRAYAKAVGLDQALALSELERALGTRSISTDRKATSDGIAAGRYRRPYLLAAFGVAIALLGIVAWYGRLTPVPTGDGRGGGAQASLPLRTGGAKAPPPQPTAVGRAEAGPAQTTPVAAESPETAATAAPAAGLITELVVITEPEGARVTVDGIGRGTTPLTIRYMAAGEKRVRVLKDGFPAVERTVRVEAARKPTTVVIPLQASTQ
jgi:transcriptional regulator with XRE-family HTH domain